MNSTFMIIFQQKLTNVQVHLVKITDHAETTRMDTAVYAIQVLPGGTVNQVC